MTASTRKTIAQARLQYPAVGPLGPAGPPPGALLPGALLTEARVAWPGVGRRTIQAIASRDYPLVQGCVLLIAGAYVLANFFTDIIYACLDPRIRYR